MDVILTISFNITAEIKITKHIKGINKQQEKYHVSREKIVQSILNIWINNLNSIIVVNISLWAQIGF